MKRLQVLVFLGLAIGPASFAQVQGPLPPDVLPSGAVLAVHVKGTTLPDGQMWYEIDPGPLATRAIRMYSEPSHTRLGMVVDPDFKKTSEGQAWLASLTGDNLKEVTSATSRLPDGHPRFQISAPPDTDAWIDVWVNGNFFGKVEDRLVASQLLMGERNFGSSTYYRASGESEKCCECGSLPDVCTECSTPFFNCCVYYQYCEIHCPAQRCGS